MEKPAYRNSTGQLLQNPLPLNGQVNKNRRSLYENGTNNVRGNHQTSLSRFGTSLSVLMGMRRRRGLGSEYSKRSGDKKGQDKQANTYKLRPSTGELFDSKRVENIITDSLNRQLTGACYDPATAKELSCRIANLIENEVKKLQMPRFKIVCHVILGENKDQGLEIASRCLWDSQTDNFACGSFENESVWATASVYGIYFE